MVRQTVWAERSLVSLALGVAVAATTSGLDAQPLPEGNDGIASQYPADQGIENDAAVVFTEDFESIVGTELTFENCQWDNVYGTVSLTDSSENVHTGSRAAEINHLDPEHSSGAWRDFGTAGFDTLHVRY